MKVEDHDLVFCDLKLLHCPSYAYSQSCWVSNLWFCHPRRFWWTCSFRHCIPDCSAC